ncbi:MAG: hypothetical protein Fur0032_15460 [Terrimicrobiaceae bacterium]
MKTVHSIRVSGFTLIEILVVVAGIAVLGGGGYVAMTGVQQTAKEQKLEADASTVNRALEVYRANGGSFTGSETPDQILSKLKTVATEGSMNMGLKSSMLDRRVEPVWQSESEASTSQLRATASWDASRSTWVFRVGKPSTGMNTRGIKEFRLNESLAAATPGTESRTATKVAAETGWHWQGEQLMASARPTGWSPTIGLQDALSQNFGNPPWTVGPSGIVTMDYVYRGAGYAGTLALVSLEGMGSSRYDLDTPEGQRQFLMEMMRRVIDGDRANIVIDVAKDFPTSIETESLQAKVVKDKQFQFRPGDTVAAILIPNGSFAHAYALLNSLGDITNNPNALMQVANNTYNGGYADNKAWVKAVTGRSINSSQLFGISSLSRTNTTNGSNFPFYQEKFAQIGGSASVAYAMEDLIINSDQDYEDIVFKAQGLTATGAFTNVINDPKAYYTKKGRWSSTNGSKNTLTLGQALLEAGIVDSL